MIAHTRSEWLAPDGGVHVVGVSSGAIVAALLRALPLVSSVSAVAGLCDSGQNAVAIDFSAQQLADMQSCGFCLKQFWLPLNCTCGPPGDQPCCCSNTSDPQELFLSC